MRCAQRRCIVSGEVMPDEALIRFVAGPGRPRRARCRGQAAGPRHLGRGHRATALEAAVEKKLFARAAKASVKRRLPISPDAWSMLLVAPHAWAIWAWRGAPARWSLGFDNVVAAPATPSAPGRALIEASDGAADGKRKLDAACGARGADIRRDRRCLTSAELGLALGRENVIHAAVNRGGLRND